MKREGNFEVLRTVAMFFIVFYHCLTHGVGDEYGFNSSHPVSLINGLFSDLILVFSSIAVNLYVMISGYFLVDRNFKLSRIIRTWANTCFYSFVITVVFMSLHFTPLSFVLLGKSFFPISTDAYWFVTQYIGLLIISPFLVLIVRQISYRQYIFLLVGGAFLCLSVIPDFPLAKRFHVAHGNSVWSFAYLFFVAGFVKLHLKRLSMTSILLAVLMLILLVFSCEVVGGYDKSFIHLYWLNYNGLVFILSVVVFIFVRQLKVPDSGLWNVLIKAAPYTFGVYLIHDHLLVRDWLWSSVSLHSYCDKALFPMIVVGLCAIIFVVCSMIEAARKKIFSWLRIDKMILKTDKWSF